MVQSKMVLPSCILLLQLIAVLQDRKSKLNVHMFSYKDVADASYTFKLSYVNRKNGKIILNKKDSNTCFQNFKSL